MRAALVVHHISESQEITLNRIVQKIHESADAGADLVLFGEAALTGFIMNDDPVHDLPLGRHIPGPTTDVLAGVARERGVWIALGLYEREHDRLYDSAVLLSPAGTIALKYRRIDPHWHGSDADPLVYRQGSVVGKVATPFGTVAFLLCGDLFDENLVRQVRELHVNWLLYPFARCFDSEVADNEQWYKEEQYIYAERVSRAGVTTLITNILTEDCRFGCYFGGSMIVSGRGEVVDRFPLGKVGILLSDF